MTKIAIIVLNWKQPELTCQTVDSLLKISHSNFDFQIYIVDNGSPDNSLATFNQKYSRQPKVCVLASVHNTGYVGGNNFGISTALERNCDYVLVINNDVLVDPHFLQKLVDSHYDIAAPKIYFAPGHEFYQDKYSRPDIGHVIWSLGGVVDWNNIYGSNFAVDEVDHGQFDQPIINPDFVSGCCFLVKANVFRQIGLFSADYFMYLEDLEFCQRAKRAGYTLAVIPGSHIWHLNAGSSQSGGDLHNYFITRNRLIFGFKYARLRTKIALFRESLRFLFGQSHWKRQAVIDFYLHRWQQGSWQS